MNILKRTLLDSPLGSLMGRSKIIDLPSADRSLLGIPREVQAEIEKNSVPKIVGGLAVENSWTSTLSQESAEQLIAVLEARALMAGQPFKESIL